jgi:hypothetical protein
MPLFAVTIISVSPGEIAVIVPLSMLATLGLELVHTNVLLVAFSGLTFT